MPKKVMLLIVLGVLVLALLVVAILLLVSGGAVNVQRAATHTTYDFIQAFETAGLPIEDVITYDEETDENGLLGRPGEYYSKVNFSHNDIEDLTIEIFNNKEDAKTRKEYIETLVEEAQISAFKQYIYLNNTYLLRIPYDVTPSDSSLYEKIFNQVISGETFSENQYLSNNNGKILDETSEDPITTPKLLSFETEDDAINYMVSSIEKEEYIDIINYEPEFNSDTILTLHQYASALDSNMNKEYFLRDMVIENIDVFYDGPLMDEIESFCLKYADVDSYFYKINKSKVSREDVDRLDPRIGMKKVEVWNSTWGYPDKTNTTVTEYGTSDQYVYSDEYGGSKYIYLDDGIVTSISY